MKLKNSVTTRRSSIAYIITEIEDECTNHKRMKMERRQKQKRRASE